MDKLAKSKVAHSTETFQYLKFLYLQDIPRLGYD